MIDEILQKVGLKYEDLLEDERETLYGWVNALDKNDLTLEKVKSYIHSMRDSLENELTSRKNSQTSSVSLLTYMIPVIGLLRKWYEDQNELEIKARIRNYMLLEQLLSSPEKAKQAIERQIASLVDSRKK